MAILAECPFCHKKQSAKNKRCVSQGCGVDLDKAKRAKKVKFWIDFRVNGKSRREPVGYSIEEARDADGKRRAQKREGRIFDILPDSKKTFKELSEWYLGLDKVKSLAYCKVLEYNLNSFNSVFGDIPVNQVKPADLENYQAKRKQAGLSDSYIDQEIGAAKRVILKASDNDLISADALKPFKRVKKLLRRNANARDRVLSPAEFDSLYHHIALHLKPVLAMAYYTGMRKNEILELTWNKVDMKGRLIRLDAMDTKDREARDIPICDELHSILQVVPRAIHDPHVFLYQGKPMRDIREGLKTACEKAGIPFGRKVKDGFTLHDGRHTFNTNMRKAGVQESVIMKITGHSSREMFDRYNTVDRNDTRKAVDQLQTFLENVDQNVDQVTGKNKNGEKGAKGEA